MKNGKSKDYLSVDGGVPSSIQKSRTGNWFFFSQHINVQL